MATTRCLATARPSRLLASAVPSLSSSSSRAFTRSMQTSSGREQYYKITLTRSAIALGSKKKGTLVSLGIHRRMQTVYHPHSPEFAGKILAVKELVRVENVSKEAVRTKTEQRHERKPSRGFTVVGSLKKGNALEL